MCVCVCVLQFIDIELHLNNSILAKYKHFPVDTYYQSVCNSCDMHECHMHGIYWLSSDLDPRVNVCA